MTLKGKLEWCLRMLKGIVWFASIYKMYLYDSKLFLWDFLWLLLKCTSNLNYQINYTCSFVSSHLALILSNFLNQFAKNSSCLVNLEKFNFFSLLVVVVLKETKTKQVLFFQITFVAILGHFCGKLIESEINETSSI